MCISTRNRGYFGVQVPKINRFELFSTPLVLPGMKKFTRNFALLRFLRVADALAALHNMTSPTSAVGGSGF